MVTKNTKSSQNFRIYKTLEPYQLSSMPIPTMNVYDLLVYTRKTHRLSEVRLTFRASYTRYECGLKLKSVHKMYTEPTIF